MTEDRSSRRAVDADASKADKADKAADAGDEDLMRELRKAHRS